MRIEEIPIEKIHIPYNPRIVFSAESLQELEESILKQGILVTLKACLKGNLGEGAGIPVIRGKPFMILPAQREWEILRWKL